MHVYDFLKLSTNIVKHIVPLSGVQILGRGQYGHIVNMC